MEKYTVTLQEHNGEVVLPIPEEVMAELGLKSGDTLGFKLNDNGSIVMEKQKLFLVKEKVVHEVTYAVYATDAESAKARIENIQPNDPEVSQQCVSTGIDSVTEATEDEVVALGQAQCSSWDRDYIINILTIDRGEEIFPKEQTDDRV